MPMQAQAFWSRNNDPDVRIAKYGSVAEACRRYHEQNQVHTVITERTRREVNKHLYRGLSDEEFKKITGPAQREEHNADQRWIASKVAVLRAAGYSDWEMYSRYDHAGIGDLWNKHIINGDKVTNNKSHPHYKYTYMGGWYSDVTDICKPYK